MNGIHLFSVSLSPHPSALLALLPDLDRPLSNQGIDGIVDSPHAQTDLIRKFPLGEVEVFLERLEDAKIRVFLWRRERTVEPFRREPCFYTNGVFQRYT